MRNLLDRLFSNRKAAIIVPIITAAVMYLLFVLFGQVEDKINWIWMIPIFSAICYGSGYFVLWIQLKNPFCSDWFLDLAELLCLAVFGLGAVSFMLRFLVNMATGFVPMLCPAILTWSAVALVDGKRK